MYTLIVQNKYGQSLELTDNEAYTIKSIDGLDPSEATINTTRNANADGSVFNSAYVNDRVITITLAINVTQDASVEENRINLYTYFQSKFPVTLYYTNESRDVYIKGWVQNNNISFFDKKQIVQITINCPSPMFNSVTNTLTEVSPINKMFEFPFSVEMCTNLLENTAESVTTNGITFTVNSDGTVTANGTATANAYLIVGAVMLGAGTTYKLTGCPPGGGNQTYRLYWQGVSGNYDQGNGTTYTPTAQGSVNIRIVIYNGCEVNDLVFSPMVRLNTVASNVYVPYSGDYGIEFSTLTDSSEIVLNDGDVETGALITIYAFGNVTNPILYNLQTNEFFGLNVSMVEGDYITINTKKKEKAVNLVAANGTTTNLIGKITQGSTWFQLVPGPNEFNIAAEAQPGDIYATFEVIGQFEGV